MHDDSFLNRRKRASSSPSACNAPGGEENLKQELSEVLTGIFPRKPVAYALVPEEAREAREDTAAYGAEMPGPEAEPGAMGRPPAMLPFTASASASGKPRAVAKPRRFGLHPGMRGNAGRAFRRHAAKLACLVLALLLCIAFFFAPRMRPAPPDAAAAISVNENTGKYHNSKCLYFQTGTMRLNSSQEAKILGFKPCGRCGG